MTAAGASWSIWRWRICAEIRERNKRLSENALESCAFAGENGPDFSRGCTYYLVSSYLAAFKQKGVPDVEVGLHRDVVDEDAEEPVEGEHGGVDAVLCEVGA